jgi:hypothetical protein
MSFRKFPKTLLSILGLAWFGGAQDSEAAIVIYYPLNETSGNMAIDAAALGGIQSATATVGASNWQPSSGILGGSLLFTPTGQTDVDEALIYNTESTATSILGSTPFTVSLWFQTAESNAFTRAAVFIGNSTTTAAYYAVGLAPMTNQPQLVARNTTAVNTAAPNPGNDGLWHHMLAVFSAPNSRTLYVDGQIAGSSTANVNHPVLNRFGVGALTRSSQTDSFNGMLDEVGLFDTALSAPEAALLNAFPRYDNVPLDDPDYAAALSVFNAQTGSVTTGTWTWSYATGLFGSAGATGFAGGNPFIVMDDFGNGLVAVPEPSALSFACAAALAPLLRRRRQPIA